ncbi:DUF1796 family putative cysteine peptidase [Priestia taiwanensis]|uniref:Papain-like cysteine peptidase n=1 Tax=Priestia taiwanensis TaxID=1347902 RepID=A0A917ERX6_9BACI|nr:DUF1796 family putative cysteine peptidase [Priestia taiwanensis]MBM7364733.1 hypothetical protein [Priestia taiwanensis]GGE79210.1 hypothetical protein GCM10007140_30970 [Priestia taiwanensis]
MKLQDIKGTYDMIYSLGNQCAVAGKLRRYQVRPYAGVIDWMISFSLPGVTNLLRNRFANFMETETMAFDGYHAGGEKLLVRDTLYDVHSAHDFPVPENSPTHWPSYPPFKEKMDTLTHRFLQDLESCEHILFVRLIGTYEETIELATVLSSVVKHNFTLLMLNPIAEHTIVEYDWDIPHVCSLGIPMGAPYDDIWDTMMSGIICSRPVIVEEWP